MAKTPNAQGNRGRLVEHVNEGRGGGKKKKPQWEIYREEGSGTEKKNGLRFGIV